MTDIKGDAHLIEIKENDEKGITETRRVCERKNGEIDKRRYNIIYQSLRDVKPFIEPFMDVKGIYHVVPTWIRYKELINKILHLTYSKDHGKCEVSPSEIRSWFGVSPHGYIPRHIFPKSKENITRIIQSLDKLIDLLTTRNPSEVYQTSEGRECISIIIQNTYNYDEDESPPDYLRLDKWHMPITKFDTFKKLKSSLWYRCANTFKWFFGGLLWLANTPLAKYFGEDIQYAAPIVAAAILLCFATTSIIIFIAKGEKDNAYYEDNINVSLFRFHCILHTFGLVPNIINAYLWLRCACLCRKPFEYKL